MRIDIGSNSLRPEIMPNKTNSDAYELNSRGENIRGRVIDVNQNIVLIQTSNGKEFTANTTIPMENFIGQEMLFNVIFTSEGQMFLRPELDQKEKTMMEALKIEDILIKLGKQLTPENKQLAGHMIKAGIPLTPENFKEMKDLTLSIKVLSESLPPQYDEKQSKVPVQQLVKQLQNPTDEKSPLNVHDLKSSSINIVKPDIGSTSDRSLKGEIYKGEIYTENKNSTYIDSFKDTDSRYFIKLDPRALERSDYTKDVITMKLIDQPVTLQNLKALNQINNIFNNEKIDITGFNEALKTIKKDNPDVKFSDKDIQSIIQSIESQIEKRIKPESKVSQSAIKQDLKIDYIKLEENLNKLLMVLTDKAGIKTDPLEKEVIPKINILNEMEKHLNYNILAFNIEKYQNKAEYYLKKRTSGKDKQDQGTTIAFSINTHRIGHVNALLTQKSPGHIEVNIDVENKLYKQKIDSGLPLLETGLRSAGFKSVILSSRINKASAENTLDDIIYKNSESKSFETWV